MALGIVLVVGATIVASALGAVGWVIGSYNTFRIGQQDIKTQWSNIRTEYQRRADLFYNLVQSVKSYKKFEKETLVEVIAARNGNFGQTQPAQATKMRQLDGIFSKLMLLVEQYPKLQANEQHNKLMEEIRITEDRINVARTDYNEIVGDYNKLVVTFPKNIIANSFNFAQEMFFENAPETNDAPKIKLE